MLQIPAHALSGLHFQTYLKIRAPYLTVVALIRLALLRFTPEGTGVFRRVHLHVQMLNFKHDSKYIVNEIRFNGMILINLSFP
jgi:hypothetical protein